MAAFINKDLTINVHEDFADDELYNPNSVPTDLSTYTAKMIVRVNKTDISTPPITLTSPIVAGSGIGLNYNAAIGAVHVAMTAAQTAALQNSMPGLTGFYDLVLTPAGGSPSVRFMQGAILLDLGVTY